MTRPNPNRRRIAASAVIAIGLAGTIIDPNGVVGVTLFGAAAAAVLYVLARPAARLLGGVARRVGGFSPTRVPALVGPRKIAAVALAAGALLGATNLFDSNSDEAISRILNDATFLGGFALIAGIALIALGTAARWARNAYRTDA